MFLSAPINFDAQLSLIGGKLTHIALFDHANAALLAGPMESF
jgi:hypothetical protein